SGGKILISNLDYGVSENDLRALFGQVGQVTKAMLNYGPNGSSKGSGVVIFKNPMHAGLAVEKYNGVHLDGRRMKLEVAFDPMAAAAAASMMMPGMVPQPMMQQQRGSNTGGSGSRSRGGKGNNASTAAAPGGGPRRSGRGGAGRRNNTSNKPDASVTADSLDADLDSYMQEGKKEDIAMAQ
ncbi:hypothetical protein GGI22_001006, partial [Coemansia erecta]